MRRDSSQPASTSPDALNARSGTGVPTAPSLQYVEHILRSGSQAALRQEIAGSSTMAVCQLLHGFSLCASSIHADMHVELVETILKLKWRDDAQLASAVCEFVQDLITASTAFLKLVVGYLIDSFLIPELKSKNIGSEAATESDAAGSIQEQVLQHVHQALHGILRVCPLATR